MDLRAAIELEEPSFGAQIVVPLPDAAKEVPVGRGGARVRNLRRFPSEESAVER